MGDEKCIQNMVEKREGTTYARGSHNAARGGFWCGSPLPEGAASNRQEIYYSDMHFGMNKIYFQIYNSL
jgi:hypothetical protein